MLVEQTALLPLWPETAVSRPARGGLRLAAEQDSALDFKAPFEPHVAARMLALAKHVSGWSTCPTGRQHGCILAVDGRYVAATGFNGPARGVSPCVFCDWDKYSPRKCPGVHAEVNAVVNAAQVGAQLSRCVAYVTKRPCAACWAVLSNARIPRLVFLDEGEG